jgi:hypothetical protein
MTLPITLTSPSGPGPTSDEYRGRDSVRTQCHITSLGAF